MGVGFHLQGRYDGENIEAAAWLTRVASWIEAQGDPLESLKLALNAEGHPTLFASLHPCTEDIEFVAPEPGRVIVSAKTSTAGPGYHIYACEWIRRLGQDLSIVWDEPKQDSEAGDETGYFHSLDRGAVEDEFLRWLGNVAGTVIRYLGEKYEHMMISMGMGYRYPGHGAVVTPMGPRDIRWLNAVSQDPRRGIDIFPWWSEHLDASFFLGRAVCTMWKDIRWRPPLNDAEAELLKTTHHDLQTAYELDPSLVYPWREWRELIDALNAYEDGGDSVDDALATEITRRAQACPEGRLIGYRRRPVQVDLPAGWLIEIPGEMVEEWNDQTWCAWDSRRTIWVTSYTFTGPDGRKPPAAEAIEAAELPDGEFIKHRAGSVIGAAVFTPFEEDGQALWQLQGRSAVDGNIAMCNVVVRSPDDRDWAASIWRSLAHP